MTAALGQEREGSAGAHRRKRRPEARVSREWGWRYALGAYVVVLILDFLLAVALPRHLLVIGIGSLALDASMLLVFVPLYRGRPFSGRDLGLRPTSGPRAVGLTFAAVVTYFLIAVIWTVAVIGIHRQHLTPQLPGSIAGKAVAGLAICLVAPVTEELFFRGLLYRALRNRTNVAWAVVIGAVLFAAGHASTYPLDTLPVKAAFGVIACLLYERTGSLYPGIALHVLVDASGYTATIGHGLGWVVPGAFLILGAVVLLRHRFRAPTEAEVAAYRVHPQVSHAPPPESRPPMMPPYPPTAAGPRASGAAPGHLAGSLSARGWLAVIGALMLIGAVVAAIIGHPDAHSRHPPAVDIVGGSLVIAGLALVLIAGIWSLTRRWARPR